MQPRSPPQPEVLAGQRQHFGIHLAHLLAPVRILGRERPRQRAGPATDVDHAPRPGRSEHYPHPPQVVELEVTRVGQVDVRRVHLALDQESPRRTPRVPLDDQLTSSGDGRRQAAGARHRRQVVSCSPYAESVPCVEVASVRKLSPAAARRIALVAQGFGRPRPTRPPSANRIARLISDLGVLQLDSVNVFLRAHYMPVFSRLGPYDRARLDRIAGHGTGPIDRRLVEYWAHEASLIPLELHPLLRWRMADVDREAWGSISRVAHEQPELVADTLELVAREGPGPRPRHRSVRSAAPAGAHVELARGQAGARASVLHRAVSVPPGG